jgi:lipid-binding SYLF domain-containing protein
MNAIKMLTRQRAYFFARLFALAAVISAAAMFPAHAETGTVRFKFFKAGWFVGAQAGTGILVFRDQIYPFRIGGISGGLTFGGSSTDLVGTAQNMHQPSDIEGVYTAVGAGIAVGAGGRVIQMRNAKGVILSLEGKQLGVAFDFDLSGMNVSIQKE